MSAEHKWRKGQSGNPTGLRKDGKPRKPRRKRPPAGLSRKELIELAQSYSKEMIERLVFWARSKNARMSVRAAQILLERAHGAPPTREETHMILHGEGDGDKIEVVFVKPVLGDDGEPIPRVIH